MGLIQKTMPYLGIASCAGLVWSLVLGDWASAAAFASAIYATAGAIYATASVV
jgi:hypothetical protein